MSALWGRFGILVNSCNPEAKEAWKGICNLDWRNGKQEAKGKILARQVVNPTRWSDFVVKESNTLTRKIAKEVKKVRYDRGELIQKPGQEEFEELLSKGKFQETERAMETCAT